EGIEKQISPREMADLLAFVLAGPDDITAVARQILDDKQPAQTRSTLVEKNAGRAPELLAALVADLKPGTPEEYRRIPWIWRVAIAAGKRNDTPQLRRIVALSLPGTKDPLRDWQAVVIGGGVINGISLKGIWPGPRIAEILKGDAGLS